MNQKQNLIKFNMRKIREKINTKITSKIILLSLSGIVILGVILGSFFTYQLYKSMNETLVDMDTILMTDFDHSAKVNVEIVISLLSTIHEHELSGKYSAKEAQELGADLVRNLEYGKNGYFWIDNKEGLNIAYLGSKSEGVNRIDAVDANGNYDFSKPLVTPETMNSFEIGTNYYTS